MPNWTTKVNGVTTVDAAHINDLQKHISWECPEYYGAVGDGVTDDTAAIQAAIDACGTTGLLRLGAKTYSVTATSGNFALTVACNISGLGPTISVIKNSGGGSAILFNGANYYTRWSNFAVEGTAASEDGIVTANAGAAGDETAYCTFVSVDSHHHGRHGLLDRMAWSTRYVDCKFYNNGGLGVYLYGIATDYNAGRANAKNFLGCESRWNGGTGDASTDYTKGGVRILGAACVAWLGGVVESNNAWGFIVSEQATLDTDAIAINGVFLENHPRQDSTSATGGHFRASGHWNNLSIENCFAPVSALAGVTSYGYYLVGQTSPAISRCFIKNNRIYAAGGGGTETVKSMSGELGGQMYFDDELYTGEPASVTYYEDSPTIAHGSNFITFRSRDAVGGIALKGSLSGGYDTIFRQYNGASDTVKNELNSADVCKITGGSLTTLSVLPETASQYSLGSSLLPWKMEVTDDLLVNRVSPGAIPYQRDATPEVFTDGGLETWASVTNLTNWTETIAGTTTINREAVEIHGGTYACRFDIDASNSEARIKQDIVLVASTAYVLTMWYKTEASKTLAIEFFNSGSNVFLQTNGEWRSSYAYIAIAASTSWKKLEILFTAHASYTDYQFHILRASAASSSIYLDDISILPASVLMDSPLSTDGVNVNNSGSYQVDGIQVVSNRVIDADFANTPNSGDADTDDLIDKIRDALITHGLIASS